jgi:hypothetical protein
VSGSIAVGIVLQTSAKNGSKLWASRTSYAAGKSNSMTKLTESEILEKWSHIAMRIFPPQTDIAVAPGAQPTIQVRWKPADSREPRGVDIRFPRAMLLAYEDADAEIQVKHDAYIEAELSARLEKFEPNNGSLPRIEQWSIESAALPADV